jgi:hypothetical protein
MDKYCFSEDIYDLSDPRNPKYMGKKKMIRYKCLICGYTHDYEDTWSDEKKSEVKAEVDAHNNEHIIPASSGN